MLPLQRRLHNDDKKKMIGGALSLHKTFSLHKEDDDDDDVAREKKCSHEEIFFRRLPSS